MKKRLTGFASFLAVGAIFFACAPSAHASLSLRLANGAFTVTIPDNGCDSVHVTYCDTDLASDEVQFTSTVGSNKNALLIGQYQITADVATVGSAPPILDLSINQVGTSNSPTALTVTTSANGYGPPAAGGFNLNIGGTLPAGSSLSTSMFGGTSNTLFDMSNQLGSTLSFSNPANNSTPGFSGSTQGLIHPSPPGTPVPYGLTLQTVFTGKGRTTFDAGIDPLPVPEPAVVTLLGGVLLVTAGAIRRRARQS
jgi:hypothetical protein